MTPQEEALVRLDMVQSDLYCKIVMMQVQGLTEVVIPEIDLAVQLGLIRAAMVQLGDRRDFTGYPQQIRSKGGKLPNANKSTDSYHQ